jgi:2-aminoethylphosphonate-pyruvate transaminase
MSTDKLLFTPGPLTTSLSVKQAMLRDLGSRDAAFIRIVKEIRAELVRLAGGSEPSFTAVPMQGSGTFAVESALSCLVDGKLLILSNGAYGRRMGQIAAVHGLSHEVVTVPEHRAILSSDFTVGTDITHIAVVHSETTTGIVNPIESYDKKGRVLIVDAMSSFGGVPVTVQGADFDVLVSSANKCIEGVPGFGFVIGKRSLLQKGKARSLSLDLAAQLKGLDDNGQFRFTPPTHSLLAFHRALEELREEGGIEGRASRYRQNAEILIAGMTKLGFELFLPPEHRGYIITSFRYPKNPNWKFEAFYSQLSGRGFVIYPGKVSDADCFRIGSIGRLHPADMQALVSAVDDVMKELS